MKRNLTAAHLKWIALVSMTIDHFAAVVIKNYGLVNGTDLYTTFNPFQADTTIGTTYSIMRIIGRLAFPLYIFLLVEGFRHTKDIKKYIARMVIFAIVSEVFFDLAFFGVPFETSHQNVFVTMTLGLIMLHILAQIEIKIEKYRFISSLLVIGAFYLLNDFIKGDYGGFGILFTVVVYLFKNNPLSQAIMMFALGMEHFTAALSGPIVYFYNGKKGKQINKYFFYIFYPLHLFIFYLIVRFFIYT